MGSAWKTGSLGLALLVLAGCWVGPNDQEMVLIPAGEFTMGYAGGEPEEKPVRKVKLKAFYIDKYLVTYNRYERFVQVATHSSPPDWDGKLERPSGKAQYPVVHVTWDDAVAFCKWEGKRLPTQAEWEKAARGTDGRLYPWGNEFARGKANIGGDGTLRIGSYPDGASPFGVLDMVGSVWQWTSDSAGVDKRIARGPAYSSTPDEGRITNPITYSRNSQAINIGFRCVKDA